jgi:hypothetical protein
MSKFGYQEPKLSIISLGQSDIITQSGDGENFGSVMGEWWSFVEGGNG